MRIKWNKEYCLCTCQAQKIINSHRFTWFLILILLHGKFLQFNWLRAVVFQLNLKHPHVKITKPLRVVVYKQIIAWFVRDIWHRYHSWYFKIVSNFIRLTAREITYNNFEISLVVFMPNIATNHAITYTNKIQDDDHVQCRRHSPPAAPPPTKYTPYIL